MQNDLSWTVHSAAKGTFFIIILLGIRRKHSAYPLSETFFSSSSLSSSLRFNTHLSRMTWLEATRRSFLLGCAPNFINTPLLYCWHWVKSFLKFPATFFHNFQKIFQTLDREQWKLILTHFNLENILSSFALETGTMDNNLSDC